MTPAEETNERNACDELFHEKGGATIQETWVERGRRAEADAARYRWLKENAEIIFRRAQGFVSPLSNSVLYTSMPAFEEMDAAIDAAICGWKEPE